MTKNSACLRKYFLLHKPNLQLATDLRSPVQLSRRPLVDIFEERTWSTNNICVQNLAPERYMRRCPWLSQSLVMLISLGNQSCIDYSAASLDSELCIDGCCDQGEMMAWLHQRGVLVVLLSSQGTVLLQDVSAQEPHPRWRLTLDNGPFFAKSILWCPPRWLPSRLALFSVHQM